tara:strand:+ start:1900 stop:2331 length:432 start_codon:yes stop_codon:yes gene_type:complete
MAPMVVIEFLGYPYTVIQQLHLDIALDLAHILDQIVPATEKAPQLLPALVRHTNTDQPAVLEFPCYELGIDPIRLGMALLATPEYIGRIDHQAAPAITYEAPVCTVSATASLISGGHFITCVMLGYIFIEQFGIGRHAKSLSG